MKPSWAKRWKMEPLAGELLLFVPLMLVAFFVRIWRLPSVPSGMLWDEGGFGLDVVPLFRGQFPVFFEAHSGHEPLFLYAQAASLKLFGWSPFSLRLPAVFLTTLSVAAAYALARKLFGRRVAWIAAFLMAVSLWQIELGRLGESFAALPLFGAITGYWLARWLRQERAWRSAVFCGLALGLLLYTYTPGRFMAFVVAAGWLWAFASRRKGSAELIRQAVACAGAAIVVFAPLGWYFLRHPASFSRRAGELSIFNPVYGGALSAWLRSAAATVLMFAVTGEHTWDKNIAGQPIFNAVLAALFVFGLALTVRRARRMSCFLALAWLLIMLVPMTLTAKDLPDFGRAIGIAPAVFLFPALAAAWWWRRHPRTVWALAAGAVVLAGLSYRDYFVVWAGSPQRAQIYQPGVLAAGQAAIGRLTAPNAPARVYFGTLEPFDAMTDFLIAGFQIEHPRAANRLIGYDARYTRVLPPSGSESYLVEAGRPGVAPWSALPGRIDQLLGSAVRFEGDDLPATAAPGQTLNLRVSWQPQQAPGQTVTLFAHVLDYAQRQTIASFDHDGFPADRWQGGETVLSTFPLAIPVQASPGAYWIELGAYLGDGQRLRTGGGQDHLLLGPFVIAPKSAVPEPPVATLGQEIELLQPDVRQTAGGLDVDLRWLPERPPAHDYSVFVHVLDSSGKLVAQADGPPAGGRWPSHLWLPGIPVTDSRHIQLPPALPSGQYRIDAGLYRLDTGERLPSSAPGGEPGSVAVGTVELARRR